MNFLRHTTCRWSSIFFYRRRHRQFSSIAPNRYDTFSLRDNLSLKILLGKFGEFTTTNERLLVSANCASKSGPEEFIIPSSEAGHVSYGVERTNCYTSAAESVHSVLGEFDKDDKFVQHLCFSMSDKTHKMNFDDHLLCSRALATIDGEKCSTSFLGLLQTKFDMEMESKTKIYPWDLNYFIYILHASNNLDRKVVKSIREYLLVINQQYTLYWKVRLALELSKRVSFKDVIFYDSLKISILSVINRQATSGQWYSIQKFVMEFFKLSLMEQRFCSICFQSIKVAILSEHFDSTIYRSYVVRSILNYCCYGHIYDKVFFDHTVELFFRAEKPIKKIVPLFTEMLKRFKRINYKNSRLLEEIIEVAEENFPKNDKFYELYWQILNYCIYLNMPNPMVLRRCLTTDSQHKQGMVFSRIFKMSNGSPERSKGKYNCYSEVYRDFLVWMCVENPHLGYSKYTDIANCESYPYQIIDIHENVSMKYLSKPERQASSKTSFEHHLSVITRGSYQKNSLTLSGHNIDYEILLGYNKQFIEFPSFLRNIPYSDGFMLTHEISKKDVKLGKIHDYKGKVLKDRVNFASDWGKYLQNDTARMPSFQKKIAIIFYTYFSGDVEVKKRLFEAMGWKVVLISTEEWVNCGKEKYKRSKFISNKLASVI